MDYVGRGKLFAVPEGTDGSVAYVWWLEESDWDDGPDYWCLLCGTDDGRACRHIEALAETLPV